MASVHTLFPTPLLSPIGYDRDGDPVWPALGGRSGSGNNGMEFLVDDRDGDEDDDFDDDEDDEDYDDGGGDDRDGDDADDGDEDDGQDARRQPRQRRQEPEADDWQPPTREQWQRVEQALKRNNSENLKRRQIGKIMNALGVSDEQEFRDFLLDRGLDPDTGTRIDGDSTAERANGSTDHDGSDDGGPVRTREQVVLDRRRSEERGAAREAARYRPAVVQFAAAAALKEAGYTGSNISMALRLLDVEGAEVDFDTDGEITIYGLDEQVEEIKKDFPELFAPKRAPRRGREDADDAGEAEPERPVRRGIPRRVGGGGARAVDGGERGRPPAKALGWLEMADRQLRGLPVNPRPRR